MSTAENGDLLRLLLHVSKLYIISSYKFHFQFPCVNFSRITCVYHPSVVKEQARIDTFACFLGTGQSYTQKARPTRSLRWSYGSFRACSRSNCQEISPCPPAPLVFPIRETKNLSSPTNQSEERVISVEAFRSASQLHDSRHTIGLASDTTAVPFSTSILHQQDAARGKAEHLTIRSRDFPLAREGKEQEPPRCWIRWTKPSSRSTEKGHMRARHQGEHIHRWHFSGEFARGQFSFYVIKGESPCSSAKMRTSFPSLRERERGTPSASTAPRSLFTSHI